MVKVSEVGAALYIMKAGRLTYSDNCSLRKRKEQWCWSILAIPKLPGRIIDRGS